MSATSPDRILDLDFASDCVSIVRGVTVVPFVSFEILGENEDCLVLARGEMLLSDYVNYFLDVEGGRVRLTQSEEMIVRAQHPSISQPYVALLSGCTVVSMTGPSIRGDDQPLTKKLEFTATAMFEKDHGKRWRLVAGTRGATAPEAAMGTE